jgi:hypothetical protein
MNGDMHEVYRAQRESQNRYTYFLLATAGAAIGLAVTQTRGAAIALSQVPLGCAVLCWGISFASGCRHLAYVLSNLYANMELLRVQNGTHPLAGNHPQIIEAASEGIRSALESNNEKASRWARWQFRFLVAGATLYVVWHVLDMYLRRFPVPWLR